MKKLKLTKARLLTAAAITVAIVLCISTGSPVIQGFEETLASALSPPVSASNPATPIQHIIIIMNENHAFDNFFGTYPKVPAGYNLTLSTCIPLMGNQTTSTPCEYPFYAGNMPQIQMTDQCHTEECSVLDYNHGRMNGFLQGEGTNRTLAYYNGTSIPELWDLASYYNLDYDFFSSALSYSEANHLFAVAANSPLAPWLHGNPELENESFLNFTYPEIGTAMTNNPGNGRSLFFISN
jgi:phospholipase C